MKNDKFQAKKIDRVEVMGSNSSSQNTHTKMETGSTSQSGYLRRNQ